MDSHAMNFRQNLVKKSMLARLRMGEDGRGMDMLQEKFINL